ncbi:complement C1q-like protein 2 isoform X2 [Xiphophorus hellerii]|uniref:complement C1q-like protein 2 isoform X2 n=1 Tax=Xiphophorus hellerii TaxID=8084 RepID=UPI0013B3F400|nr:complement C1q-like protein 2 isoform X2 [Xiphophorus hellerii]
MNFTTWMLVLFCGLTLAQNDVNETEISGETKLSFPEMSLLLLELGAVKAKLEAVETKLKETESQVLVLNEKGKSLETKLEGTESQVLVLNEKDKSLETKLKETESQVLVLQDKEATKVVFSAGIGGSVNIGPFTTPKTLAYTTVITSLGNAYNQHTGIFVAPVRGIYYFSFFYHAGGGYSVTLRLMKNNQIVLESTDYKTSHDAADNGGNAGLVELQQRDQVYVQLYANTHVWGNIHTTTFSGFLLHKV